MINDLLAMLLPLRSGFSRKATFEQLLTIARTALLREDHLGVTSLVRATPGGDGSLYLALLGFFRSAAWTPAKLLLQWGAQLVKSDKLWRVNGRAVVVGTTLRTPKKGAACPASAISGRPRRPHPNPAIIAAIYGAP